MHQARAELWMAATSIMPRKRRRGEVEDLPLHDLPATLESAITSHGSAELAVLFLIEKYDFNLDALRGRLQGSYCFRLAITRRHHLVTYYDWRKDYRSTSPNSSTVI
jgi:hypothetical protein